MLIIQSHILHINQALIVVKCWSGSHIVCMLIGHLV